MTTKPNSKKNPRCVCKTHTHCLNCDRRLSFRTVAVNGYCKQCWVLARATHLNGRHKCVVGGCQNWSDQGTFVGDLFGPCYRFVLDGSGIHSQAFRNSVAILAKRVGFGFETMLLEMLSLPPSLPEDVHIPVDGSSIADAKA
jgi:hypothetical protein